MATVAQIAANRANAQLSTGPRTEAGKVAVSANARKHGLSATRFYLLPDEDASAYDSLLDALLSEHRAVGPTEEFLVNEMAQAQWKLQRIDRMQMSVMTSGDSGLLTRLDRYEQSARRAWYKALNQLLQLRKQRPAPPPPDVPRAAVEEPTPAYPPQIPAHLERELAAHRRRDPLFDPYLDRTQMSKALQKCFPLD